MTLSKQHKSMASYEAQGYLLPEAGSVKKGVFRNFARFTGKHLWQSLFFNKVAGLRSENLSKRDSGTGVFL